MPRDNLMGHGNPGGMMLHRIALVRHGRSAHAHSGWYDRAGVERWLQAYDDAGIAPGEAPPAALLALAARASAVVTSDIRRARESAALLGGDATVVHASELLREMPLPIPELGRLRLPIAAWALAIGINWMRSRRSASAPSLEHIRAQAAAAWLGALVRVHASLVVVTHASFRHALADALVMNGWTAGPGRRSMRPWSAWEFSRSPA